MWRRDDVNSQHLNNRVTWPPILFKFYLFHVSDKGMPVNLAWYARKSTCGIDNQRTIGPVSLTWVLKICLKYIYWGKEVWNYWISVIWTKVNKWPWPLVLITLHVFSWLQLPTFILQTTTVFEPEDHWSCITHLSAEDMLKSAVTEEKV